MDKLFFIDKTERIVVGKEFFVDERLQTIDEWLQTIDEKKFLVAFIRRWPPKFAGK